MLTLYCQILEAFLISRKKDQNFDSDISAEKSKEGRFQLVDNWDTIKSFLFDEYEKNDNDNYTNEEPLFEDHNYDVNYNTDDVDNIEFLTNQNQNRKKTI